MFTCRTLFEYFFSTSADWKPRDYERMKTSNVKEGAHTYAHTVWNERVLGGKIEKSQMERLRRVIGAFKHLEGDRKRIVKCIEEMGRERGRDILAEDERRGAVGPG